MKMEVKIIKFSIKSKQAKTELLNLLIIKMDNLLNMDNK